MFETPSAVQEADMQLPISLYISDRDLSVHMALVFSSLTTITDNPISKHKLIQRVGQTTYPVPP